MPPIHERYPAAQAKIDGLVEDIEFLAHPDLGGVRSPMVLAERLGYKHPRNIARRLYRNDRIALANFFEQLHRKEEIPWPTLAACLRGGNDESGVDSGAFDQSDYALSI